MENEVLIGGDEHEMEGEIPNFSLDMDFLYENNPIREQWFTTLTDTEMDDILKNPHAEKTKKNKKWAVKTFKGTEKTFID